MGLFEWIVLGGTAILLKKSISETAAEKEREERELREFEEELRKAEKLRKKAERENERERKRAARKLRKSSKKSSLFKNNSSLGTKNNLSAGWQSHNSNMKPIPSVSQERKNVICRFNEGISFDEFTEIAQTVGSQFRRINNVIVQGPTVCCTVESQSKQSKWEFSVNFNNWGHITGRTWIWSENDDSNMAKYFADAMAAEIQYILEKRNVHFLDYAEIVRSNDSLKDERDLTFYNRTGFFRRLVSGEPTATLEFGVQEMLGEHLYLVVSMLKRSGFTNVKSIPIKDVGEGSSNYLYEVAQVIIDGSAARDAGDSFIESCEVIITYHDKFEIRLPFSARHFKNANYCAAGDELQELGFTEIYERPIRDLITGWLKADGSVERITIDGHSDFKKDDVFTYDKKIVIEFHTFKKK